MVIVFETFIEAGKKQLRVNEVVLRVFRGAEEYLLGKVNGNEFSLSEEVKLVTGHAR